jgi:superfamily II DNA or RNA helicase/HKD family nuclease
MSRPRGLYEVLVTAAIASDLRALGDELLADTKNLRPAEAADRIALHIAGVVERAVGAIPDAVRVHEGLALARSIVAEIDKTVADVDLGPDAPIDPGTVLRAVLARLPDGKPESIDEPLIPLLDTALLTNAPGEPRVGSQLLTEIHSADRIDLVMAFIRRSGIAPLRDALRKHCANGRMLRVLTTTYTGSTEERALEELRELGADVRVSYDTTTTRLHAKAWLFHRLSDFSTAYIGSSNLTHSAQVNGLEWNVRVSAARNPDVTDKVAAVFESYWNNGDFVPYVREDFRIRTRAAAGPTILLSPIEVRPEPFQERLLEQIVLARTLGRHRNLLVSATGTGKTVMAAIDYARLRTTLARARLLFVAHREEILAQSLATFRQCLRDPSFGERWVAGDRPREFEHVFASIQSLSATGLAHLDPAHFDVVIVDEFHHAAASTYRALLDSLEPIELLGLTATPERSDGLPILEWFDGRIAAELRLWDAIDQHRLAPFAYYGIHDGLDLRDIPWRRGRGYDVDGLTNLLTGNDAWARQVISQVARYVDDPHRMRALGFCVGVEHARYMARMFREAGLNAVAIWSDSSEGDRQAALKDLAAGRVAVVFSVDLLNEGVDVPVVDTLLMLRPTDSPLLFLQQLGRGLRLSPGKTVCTVLDFIGQHRKEFRFDRRFQALLGGTRRSLVEQIERGFPFLPAGCHLQLDAVAREHVLENIRAGVPSRWHEKVEELRRMLGEAESVTLATYLRESGMHHDDVYAGDRTWSELCAEAGIAVLPSGPKEDILRRAVARIRHVDDALRIDAYRRFLALDAPPVSEHLDVRDRRLLRMLIAALMDRAITKDATMSEASELLWAHPQIRREMLQLLEVLAEQIVHLPRGISELPDVPLQVHARYTRIEILAALGVGKPAKVAPWQTGVHWAREANADLLAFTLDKTDGYFSPRTRYRDYAISPDLIHWQSQSVTRERGRTGLRYQNHASIGSSILLFARLRTDDRAFWFLGPATYVSHEREMPMSIRWRLSIPLPGDLFATFAAAVA